MAAKKTIKRKRPLPAKTRQKPNPPPPPGNLIKIGELAKLKGVSWQSVRAAAKPGGKLFEAYTREGFIDRDHPCVDEYLKIPPVRGRPELVARRKAPPTTSAAKDVALSLNVDLSELIKQPFGEVLEKYGSIDRVYQMARSRKELAYSQKAQIQSDELRGHLIRRDFVKQHVMGELDGLFRRLLGDLSATVANKVRIAAKGGASPEDCRTLVHDLISAEIVRAKEIMIERLETGQAPATEADDEEQE